MPTPISLKLVIDRDSINADLTGVLNTMDSSFQYAANKLSAKFDQIGQSFGKSMLESVRQMDSSLQYAMQRWTTQFQELGARLGNGINGLKVGGGGPAEPKGIADVEGYVGHLTNVLESRLIGPNGLMSRVERLSGYNPDTGGLTRASVTYKGDEATRIRISENSPYVDPRVARAESFVERAMMWADRFAGAGKAAVVENLGAGGTPLPPFVSRSPGFTAEDLMSLRLRGARIDSDVAFGGITSDSSAALRAQQAQYDQIMASVGQEKLGMILRGARIDADVAAEESHRNAVLRQQGILYGNLQSGAFLEDGGYRRTSTAIGPDGNPTSESYRRGAGLFTNAESATRNLQTGELRRQIEENTSLAHRMWAAIAGEGSKTSQAINVALAPLNALHATAGKIVGVFHTIGNEAIRISALFYSFRRIGEGIGSLFGGPIEYVMNATAKGREFESSIAGLAGVGGARDIDRQLVGSMMKTPFSLDETRQQFMDFSKIGPFAGMIASGGGMQQFSQFQQIVAGLQTLNPGADTGTITQGITGALLGQGRSLRGVVRIDPDQLAELVGHSNGQRAFRDNPELLFEALQRYVQVFAAPGAVQARQNLPGVQLEHIKSTFEDAVSRIGDSGIFDAVVKELQKVADGMFQYVQSPEFQAKAEQISGYLQTILGNIGDAVNSFLAGFTGKSSLKKEADGVAEGVAGVVKSIADASNQLPAMAMLAGRALQFLSANVADFADFIIRTTDKFTTNKNPLSEQESAQLLSKRLAMVGFGPDEQSVQEVPRNHFGDGSMRSAAKQLSVLGLVPDDATRAANEWKVVPAGKNYDKIQDLIDRWGKMSDTAKRDPVFTKYLWRDKLGYDIADIMGHGPAGFGDVHLPGGFGNPAAAGLQAQDDAQRRAMLAFTDAAGTKDPQLQSLMFQQALGGLMNLSPDDRFDMLDKATKSRLSAATQYGNLMPKYDSLSGLLAGRQSAGGDKVQILQDALFRSQMIANDRQANAIQNPGSPEAQAEFQAAAKNVAIFSAELQKAQAESNQLTTSILQFGNTAQQTFENGLGKALTDIETKTGNVRAAFAAMAKDILGQFNSMMMKNIFGAIFGTPNGQPGIGNGIGGALSGASGGLFNAAFNWAYEAVQPTVSPYAGVAADPAASTGASMLVGAADGGLFRGGLRFFASGGVVKGGPGQLAIIGEGGLGADEAVVPMRNGYLPIGHDGGGMHAVLPGGRRIPAAMFADGGITGGGNVATMGAASAFSAPSMGGRFGGDGDVYHTTNVVLDGKVLSSHTEKISRTVARGEIQRAFRPGGDGRRASSRA